MKTRKSSSRYMQTRRATTPHTAESLASSHECRVGQCDHKGQCICAACNFNKPQHTPTPWHLHDTENATICGPDHLSLALCEARSRKGSENDANAAFIVRAVNSHEALLDVVKEALCHLDPNCEYDGANANGKEVSEYAKLVIAMYEAIAKAEGKS